MALIEVPFASFTPDLPAMNNPGSPRIVNATAGRGSAQGAVTLYPMKAASLYSSTSMVSRPLGTAIGQDRDGNAKVYGGCATKLYKLAPSTRQWTDISRVAGYTTSATERWRSVEFRSMQVFTNFNDEPQYLDMNVDLQFANLTSLVKGRHIATHKGFVILGNTYDSLDGAVPYRVRWSAIENPFDWSFSAATQSDFQDIHGYGAIQGIVTDDSCYIILQRGIVQATYIGSPFVFQFDDRVVGKGCSVPNSIITVSGLHFFLSDDGFYMLHGGQLTPIGEVKVNKWFLENFDSSQASLMTVAADPREALIYWQFCSKASTSGTPDLMLTYNYHSGEWTRATATTSFIFNSVSLPWTVDQFDAAFGTIDAVPASFDDPIWAGGQNMLWGMSATGAVYSFSGETLELQYDSPEIQASRLIPNEHGAELAIISRVLPKFEGAGDSVTARVQVGTKMLPNSDIVWSDMQETNSESGYAYFRNKSRYQRFRVRISGPWTRAYAMEIDAKPSGRR